MQDFYEKMIFIGGLTVEVQVKVMEAMLKFANDALKVTITTETLILDKKDNLKIPIKIMAVEAECNDKVLEEEDMDEEEAALNSLNAIRIQKGKTPSKKFPRSNGNGNGNGGADKMTNGEPMKCA